jgi:hypothetical protein
MKIHLDVDEMVIAISNYVRKKYKKDIMTVVFHASNGVFHSLVEVCE